MYLARTVGFKISKEQEDILNLVIEGHSKGREAVRPGIKIDEVDRAIRNLMREEGYEKYFLRDFRNSIRLY